MVQLSRRALLKGAAFLAAAGVNTRLLSGCDDGARIPNGPRPIERKTLHISLDGFRDDVEYTLDLGDRLIELRRHDETTLAQHRREVPLLRSIPDAELTHYVPDVSLAGDAPQSYTASYAIPGTEMRALALAAIHIPEPAILMGQAIKGQSYGVHATRRAKYGFNFVPARSGGLHVLAGSSADGDVSNISDLSLIVEEEDAARYLVFHHPDILALDGNVAALLLHHLDAQSVEMQILARLIARLGRARNPDESPTRTSWARGTYLLDPDGKKVPQTNEDGSPILVDGKPAYQWYYAFPPEVMRAVSDVVVRAMRAIYDDPDLEDKRFHVEKSRSSRAEPLPDAPPLLQGPTAPSAYTFAPLNENWTGGQCVSGLRVDGEGRRVSFDVGNSYNRTVSVYCGFFDANGKLLKRAEIGADAGDNTTLDTEYLQHRGMISPALWLLGIPVAGTVARERFTARIPDKATSLGVFVGSLSFLDMPKQYDERGKAATAGLVATLICELGVPTIALAYGALFDAGTTLQLKRELLVPAAVLAVKLGANIYSQVTTGSAEWINLGVWVGNQALKLALAKASTALLWGGAIAAGTAAKGIPIAGTAIFALNAADTAQSIGRTIGGLSQANAVYTTEIRATNTVRVKVTPSDVLGLPQTGVRYELMLVNKTGMSLAASGDYAFLTQAAGFEVDVTGVPSGGEYKAVLRILSSTGFLVGFGQQDFVNAVPNGAAFASVECVVKNQTIPITKDTTYSVSAELAVVSGSHKWVAPTAPPGGYPDACAGGSEIVCAPTGIGIDAHNGNLGYAWQAAEQALPICGRSSDTGGTSLHTMRNLNLNVFVEKGALDANVKDYACGDLRPVVPMYSLREPKSYVLEASTGQYVLRELDLSLTGASDFRRGQPIARLGSTTVRAAAVYDNRYAMIISGDAGVDRLEVIELKSPQVAVTHASDERLPRAHVRSGPGTLRGNIRGAVALCQAFDGDVFIVLENGNKRLQAFGVTGEPAVDYFHKAGGSRSAILELPSDREYLDVGCELESGAIYVLSRRGRSRSPTDFYLDIYKRTSPEVLATTRNFAAAKFALDTNQNIISLGWNELVFRGRREPGLWRWIPTTP